MKITPESKPISEIFPIEGQIIYRVPVYQRNYSWNTDNIDDLFNDINNERNGYYIGNLLVSKDKENLNKFDIVDGQQRLTTIALFFLSIFEIINEMSTNANSEDLENIHVLKYDIKRKLIGNGKSRLELLNRDKEVLESYLGILDRKEKGKFGNRYIASRYKYIQEIMTESFKNFKDIKIFYEKLNNVEFLKITVDDVSDAFTVFSSLNAKGLPLTLIDLLKSQYLGLAMNNNLTEDEAYEKWSSLIDIFSDSSQEPNSFAITQFLLNNFDTFEGKDNVSITKRNALRKYKDLFDKKGYSYMDELMYHAKIFSLISPLIENDNTYNLPLKLNNLILELMKLDSSQSYPLMLFLLKKHLSQKANENEIIKIFEFLRNFYVRRNIVLKPKASNIRFRIIDLVRKLNDKEVIDETSVSLIRENLILISSSDNEFLSSLNENVYEISPQTVRFVLIKIERTFGQYFNKQNPDTLDKYKDSKTDRKIPIWTLEHILPETNNLKYGWPEMISPNDLSNAKNVQQKNMHKIGNLTLSGYNSEMSDRGFLAKRDYKVPNSENYVGLKTNLFLNSSIPDVTLNEKIEIKNSWTIKDINRRTEHLAEMVLNLYKL